MFVQTLKGSLKCLKIIFWLFQNPSLSQKDNLSSPWLGEFYQYQFLIVLIFNLCKYIPIINDL